MRYASVCDGIGAVHVAWQPLGWECAWTSEIEPFPAAVVDHHWGVRNVGDMTEITGELLNECGPVSLLVGGTPCQSFSVAGLRRGLDDPRGNLALRFVQLVGVMRPTWVVWENVPGVLSSAGGRDFGTFLGALAELGYGFAYRILDAQWFGVAQRRRRVFVVGHARDWRRSASVLFEFDGVFGDHPTRGEARKGLAADFADRASGGSRLPIAFGGQMSTPQVDIDLTQTLQRKNPQAVAVDLRNHSLALKVAGTLDTSHPSRGGGQAVLAMNNTGHGWWEDAHGVASTIRRECGTSSTMPTAVVAYGDTVGTLRGNHRNNSDPVTEAAMHVMHGTAVRRLTPLECERLQGFPDGYTDVKYRGRQASDGPRYKALGNSMAVPVMAWIGKRIAAVEAMK